MEQVFTDHRTGVDEGFVLLARLALSDYIRCAGPSCFVSPRGSAAEGGAHVGVGWCRKHQDEPLYGGLSMAQMVEAEDSTIDKYCAAQIERMGTSSLSLIVLFDKGPSYMICALMSGMGYA